MNNITILGRVGAPPESQITNNGTAVTNLRVAVDRTRRGPGGERETDWFTCKAFGKTAEIMAKLEKGETVALAGSMQAERWVEAQGTKRERWVLIVERMSFVGSRGDRPAGQPPHAEAPRPAASQPDAIDFDSEIPF